MVRSEADLAARYGGEELALLLAHCDEAKAASIAQRLLASVQALAIEHRASNVADCVTISIGFASFVPVEGRSPDEIIRSADEALYRAKASGRNRVCGPGTD
jgi:diguanylate cyclase (GGDEF)-like protein